MKAKIQGSNMVSISDEEWAELKAKHLEISQGVSPVIHKVVDRGWRVMGGVRVRTRADGTTSKHPFSVLCDHLDDALDIVRLKYGNVVADALTAECVGVFEDPNGRAVD